MKRETALIAALAAVVVASALALLLIPGALGDPGDERDVPSGRLHVVEMPIEVGTVSKQTATLTVNPKFQHRGPSLENVSVVIRAIDEERGVVETKTRVEIGAIEEETEVPARATLTVDRQGAYRFEVIAYNNGKRVPGGEGSRVIEGIGTLEPTYEQSTIEFQRFDNSDESLPTIGYSIGDTGDGSVTLALSTHLINGGTEQAGDLTLVLLARQADSNVIANRTTVQVGQIQPGQTRATEAELTVPDDYNYYLVGLLKRDDVIVDTTRSAANLDPSKTVVVVNETTQEDEFDAGDFDQSDDETPPDRETRTESGGGSGPGFGIGIALIALLAVATLAARRNRH